MSTIALTHNPSFYERVVMDMLSKMDKGRLDVSLPGGQSVTLGNGEGGIRADMSINDIDFFRRCVLKVIIPMKKRINPNAIIISGCTKCRVWNYI